MGRVLSLGMLAAGPATTLTAGIRAVRKPKLRSSGVLGIALGAAAATLLATGVVPVP